MRYVIQFRHPQWEAGKWGDQQDVTGKPPDEQLWLVDELIKHSQGLMYRLVEVSRPYYIAGDRE